MGGTPALAIVSEEDDGFDLRIIAVLALPALAASWALFNVWRVAFRQTVRLGEEGRFALGGVIVGGHAGGAAGGLWFPGASWHTSCASRCAQGCNVHSQRACEAERRIQRSHRGLREKK